MWQTQVPFLFGQALNFLPIICAICDDYPYLCTIMEKFELHILGSGSALPTTRHFPTSQVVNLRDKLFMIDCGEGAQLQFRKSRLKFSRLNRIFISHLHGDHCFGLLGLISTHDMSTLRGWWEEDFQQTQRYYNTMLGHYGAAPAVATPELCEEVVRKHLQSNSILAILSLQDWMSMDGKWRNPNAQEERINVPANPRHYWRWRMHLTLEQLMKAESLNEKIKELIAQTGR